MIKEIPHSVALPKSHIVTTGLPLPIGGGLFMKKPILIEDLGLLHPTKTSNYRTRYGIFQCPYCENKFKAQARAINSRHISSCGCLRRKTTAEKNFKHGLSHHPLFDKYNDMINRCFNPKCNNFKKYGEIGITVCDEWRRGFDEFLKWDKVKDFKKGDILDRIKNDGNYSPDNCRWVNAYVSMQNTRLLSSKNTSGYRGVSFCKKDNTYTANIGVNGKIYRLGRNKNPKICAKYYNDFVIKNKTFHPLNIILND